MKVVKHSNAAARHVYAVDVGRGQLHWKLRNEPRVVVMESQNARALTLVTSDHPETPVEILKSKIEARMKSTTSAMPETTLDPYSPAEIQGLIAYLLAGPGGA